MKRAAIMLLILTDLSLSGQVPEGVWDASVLTDRTFDWSHFDQTPSATYKANIYKQLFEYDSTNYVAMDYPDFVNRHQENIHFVDLDLDGDPDVVYDGIAGGYEVGFVDLYKVQEETIQLVHRDIGRVYWLDVESGELRIQTYPCCDQKINVLKSLLLDRRKWTIRRSEDIEVFVGRGSMGDSILPPTINTSTRMKISEATKLHWSPDTTDFDLLEVCQNSETNVIATLPAGTKCEVLWSSKKCRWVFVRVFDTRTIPNYCLGWNRDIAKARSVNTYGWMKE